MKRIDAFYTVEVPAAVLQEMTDNAREVFNRNMRPDKPMDYALGATYLDGFVTGALFVLKHGAAGLKRMTGEV